MRIPGVKTAKGFFNWLQARIQGGAMILGYHRIAEEQTDVYDVCVTPMHFEEQMYALSQHANVVSLSKLVKHLDNGSLPTGTVAVTFDDGYADNLYQAKPILEKYQIPATVFMCTGFWGRQFWWDELDRLVMESDADPFALRLDLDKSHFHRDPPPASSEPDPSRDASVRKKLCEALYHHLLPLDVNEQNNVMDVIRSWSGLSTDVSSQARAMTQAELLQFAECDLFEVGAHTRNHPMLPYLALERQREEIVSSRQDLEQLLGKPVRSFSYPNGKATEDAKRIVQEAGFAFACTSLQNVVRPGCDLHELTRFWQKDVDGEQFLRALKRWTGSRK